MLDAVLLEWEGVLADTGIVRRDELLRALADEGVHWTAEAYDASCGELDTHAMAVTAFASVGRIDATLAELVALRVSRACAERLSRGFSLQPGAAQFVSALAPHVRLAIVTRARRAETAVALAASGLIGFIATVVTVDDVVEGPPAPSVYTKALASLSRIRPVASGSSVAIVDSAAAVHAARAAGVHAITVGTSTHVSRSAHGAVNSLTGLTHDGIVGLLRELPAARA
ncbi:MAG: HAD hydrolase-like protein [Gemmatimonadaceae bacterium]|nr:HAD hydrolase-like protein [Gemmatimonadaceae bacterium]